MLIVLPVCDGDAQLLVKNLEWMRQLHGKMPSKCLISFESDFKASKISSIAAEVFDEVLVLSYPKYIGNNEWPRPQNNAFQQTARHIATLKWCNRWLWLEADAIPLKPDWIKQIKLSLNEKPFAGHVVTAPGYDPYMVGVGVYPNIISDYSVKAMLCRSAPWDMACSSDIVPSLVNPINHLIHHIRMDGGITFKAIEDVKSTIPDSAVLFHKCKDGSLIDVLRKNETYSAAPTIKKVINTTKMAVREIVNGGSSYYHSGNLGDIIYALYAIKENGGGDLLIGPQQIGTSPTAVPIVQSQFDLLFPLLKCQSYIKRCEFKPRYPTGEFKHDLNGFRNLWNDWQLRQKESINSLCAMHFQFLGILPKFKHGESWLKVKDPIKTDRIIVNRSFRYRSENNPWPKLTKLYRDRMLFVGHFDEYEDFCKLFGRIPFWRITDFLELARLIAGAKAFFGNQSFPCSLALGLGQRVYQESWGQSEDCKFVRSTFKNQVDKPEEVAAWL